MDKRLDKIFKNSNKVTIDDNAKLFIMSDCHRGAGDNLDNFVKNRAIFEAALLYYDDKGFTYIELGDGDEMWEVEDYSDIVDIHLNVFKQLKKFYDSGRLIMIYGNHDIEKRSDKLLEKYFYKYYDKELRQEESLLDGLKVYESLVLDYRGYDIFLIHGHQVDFLNSMIWRVARFLVRYVWRPLEWIGIKVPIGAAKNYRVTRRIEKNLKKWSIKNNKILIAGHTHRAIFPRVGQDLYFNDGSCIHPNGITCLEIENGKITLVRWEFKVTKDKLVTIERRLLEGEESIVSFFNKI